MSLKNRYFSYRDSHFRMDKDKENTARMVLYNQLDITNCYTMESSFFGPSSEAYQFTPDDLGYIGRDLALVSLNFTTQSVISKKMIIVKNYLGGIQKVFRASRTHDENLDTIAKAQTPNTPKIDPVVHANKINPKVCSKSNVDI